MDLQCMEYGGTGLTAERDVAERVSSVAMGQDRTGQDREKQRKENGNLETTVVN
ncbi:unnamed protein product [Fusarium graminearum]|uniref:Chromosome 3, complete genome n=1 Tax=Gibberella zeae (strain ATCC MYA-4620 / CBS 123657 / FGSC 9075 / NRRL 31084 / PH-1) TaxID=229533 RepID=A0A098E081_GIBZE|nr:unnamed protein product [Fusarium graminearum]CZS85436.1 unnamed protein product [Fusarium graminearum]